MKRSRNIKLSKFGCVLNLKINRFYLNISIAAPAKANRSECGHYS